MSMPGFSGHAALYQVSRIYRAASGHHSATAGVQPAMRISVGCTEISNDYNWSCTVRWWFSPTCGGYSTTYANGYTESDHWCD
jgi:hypothetical protein